MKVCARCKGENGGETMFEISGGILFCTPCFTEWARSAEAKRLQAIMISVIAEWSERTRCETNVTKQIAAINAAPTEGKKDE